MSATTTAIISKVKPSVPTSKKIILNGLSNAIKPHHAAILQAASIAQDSFATQSQEDADRIFTEVAKTANKSRVPLASLAFDETKMGCFEDKVLKNGLACELISDRYKDIKTCGLVSSDDVHGIRTYASPGKSEYVLFCCVLCCVQYEASVIRILHLNLVCLYVIAFASRMY